MTIFGQTKIGLNQVWSEPSLAKSTIFGQIDQNSCFHVLSQFLCLANVGSPGLPHKNQDTSSPGHPLPRPLFPQDSTGPPSAGQPKISLFFFNFPATFFFLSSRWILVVFWRPGPSNVHVWALGKSCEAPAALGRWGLPRRESIRSTASALLPNPENRTLPKVKRHYCRQRWGSSPWREYP